MHRLTKVRLLPLLPLFLLSLGCDRLESLSKTPGFVRELMDAEVPADGRIYTRAKGSFEIEQETAFCTFRPGYGLDGGHMTKAIKQIDEEWRYLSHRAGVSNNCASGRPVFVISKVNSSSVGKPYQLVLAVWQGDAAWVGFLSRPNGVRPGVKEIAYDIDFGNAGAKQTIKRSIDLDMSDLSMAFTRHLLGNKK